MAGALCAPRRRLPQSGKQLGDTAERYHQHRGATHGGQGGLVGDGRQRLPSGAGGLRLTGAARQPACPGDPQHPMLHSIGIWAIAASCGARLLVRQMGFASLYPSYGNPRGSIIAPASVGLVGSAGRPNPKPYPGSAHHRDRPRAAGRGVPLQPRHRPATPFRPAQSEYLARDDIDQALAILEPRAWNRGPRR